MLFRRAPGVMELKCKYGRVARQSFGFARFALFAGVFVLLQLPYVQASAEITAEKKNSNISKVSGKENPEKVSGFIFDSPLSAGEKNNGNVSEKGSDKNGRNTDAKNTAKEPKEENIIQENI